MKPWLARLLGRTGPPVVAVFLSGPPDVSRRMAHQMRELLPDHPHVIVGPRPVDAAAFAYAQEVVEVAGSGPAAWREARRRLRGRWIALAPFVWQGGTSLRWAPWLVAPRKLLAFNAALERHHLRLSCPLASWRFLRGEAVGDIFRPTAFAPLRRLPARLAAGRLPEAAPLAAALPARSGLTVFDAAAFWEAPDRAVAESATEFVGVGDDPGRLSDLLAAPEVWLAFEDGKAGLADGQAVPGHVIAGERGTPALAHQPGTLLFRRDDWLTLGGAAAGGLLPLTFRGWRRGRRSVFAGGRPAEPPSILPGRGPAFLAPGVHVFAGRAARGRLKVAVATPYFPFPLSHGGAIRIYNLLRHAADHADLSLFAFAEKETIREIAPLQEFCSRITLVRTPRWDPPAVVRTLPNGVAKFKSRAMSALLASEPAAVTQIEYTQLAHLGPAAPGRRILVEHDVTFDLHRQLAARASGRARFAARLEAERWRRYEVGHARAYDRVVAMSGDDLERLAGAGLDRARLCVIENGVDLERFEAAAAPDEKTPEVLFIGSFRHFPNILGYRYLLEGVWPKLRSACPGVRLTVVGGAGHDYYWKRHSGEDLKPPLDGVQVLDFVEDVRPLYRRATVVAVPLVVSAGTNLKVLEALAMQRALVSTAVGVAGLGLTPGEHYLRAEHAEEFAAALRRLLEDRGARETLAAAGRALAEERYGWRALAKKQVALWEGLSRVS